MDPFHALHSSYDHKERVAGEDSLGGKVPNPGCQISISSERVRKSGARVHVEEGRALRFARAILLPVPNVFEVNVQEDETEIVMEFVQGDTLEVAWGSMDAKQKHSVALQLRHIVTVMREARADQKTIGAIGGPVRDCRQFSEYLGGPFEREADFNEFVLDFVPGTPELLRLTLCQALNNDSRIVFTHGDLSPRNIIVRDGQVQALLDWEYSGWYPEYWEFVKFFDRPTNCKGWRDYAEVIFDTIYSTQLLAFQALARWQKP